jgi:hypothetical protein
MLLSAPAYLFTFLFLRRFGGASVAVATAGALLFTFPNNLYLKSGQVQHFVAYYLPIARPQPSPMSIAHAFAPVFTAQPPAVSTGCAFPRATTFPGFSGSL